jgi:hypothetical protein
MNFKYIQISYKISIVNVLSLTLPKSKKRTFRDPEGVESICVQFLASNNSQVVVNSHTLCK